MKSMSRRKVLGLAGAASAAFAATHVNGKAHGQSPVSTADYGAIEGKSLWEVVEEMVGDVGSKSHSKSKKNDTKDSELSDIKSQVCFDTPFGRICIDLDLREAVDHEEQLKEITLAETISSATSHAKLRGACTTVCVYGVCVTHCW